MALVFIEALPERYHFLPDKMDVWRKDEAQKAFSNIPLSDARCRATLYNRHDPLKPLGSVAHIMAKRVFYLTIDTLPLFFQLQITAGLLYFKIDMRIPEVLRMWILVVSK